MPYTNPAQPGGGGANPKNQPIFEREKFSQSPIQSITRLGSLDKPEVYRERENTIPPRFVTYILFKNKYKFALRLVTS